MNGAIDTAIDRIRDEMAAESGDQMVQMIGEHLTEYIRQHPAAELTQGATIKGAVGKMYAEAGKRRGGKDWAALYSFCGATRSRMCPSILSR